MAFLFSKGVAFSPDVDIPKLDGKVILVTGGTLPDLSYAASMALISVERQGIVGSGKRL